MPSQLQKRESLPDYICFGAANPETIRVIKSIDESYATLPCDSPKCGGFLDNDESKWGMDFYGYSVIGGIDKVASLSATHGFVNIITGSTTARYEVSRQIAERGGRLTNLIHPSVDTFMTIIGDGAYVQENVVIQAAAEIGENCSVHTGAIVAHETKVGHSVFIAHCVSVSGSCIIGDGTFVGTNATILPRVKIGKWCTIGAGAVVRKDVPDYAVVVGNPARQIKDNPKRYDSGKISVSPH